MNKKLYIVYDNVAEEYTDISAYATNGKMGIRKTLNLTLSLYPIKDVELREIDIEKINYNKINWKDYKFPETKAEALEPLGIDPKNFEETVAKMQKSE